MAEDRISYLKTTIRDVDANTRIKKWIVQHHRAIVQSKEACRRAFRRNEIFVNGEPVEETRILQAGDVVEVRFDKRSEEQHKLSNFPLEFRYQDQHVAVIRKDSGQSFGLFEKALQLKFGRRVWCAYNLQKAASGLVLVALTDEAKDGLNQDYLNDRIDVTMRVMCHGKISSDALSAMPAPRETAAPSDDMETDDDEKVDRVELSADRLMRNLTVVKVTRSNNAGYISTLDLALRTPVSSGNIRSYFFYQTPFPIIGNSNATKPLKSNRDKGLSMSIMRLSFTHPLTGEVLSFAVPEPEKFELVRSREERFWAKKMDTMQEAMKKAGVALDDLEDHDIQKEPLAYRLGEKDFYGLRFKVTDACLIPRPCSETVVEAALELLRNIAGPAQVLDVGTGSGNILLAILHSHPNATGVGLDISEEALAVARDNAVQLGLDSRVKFVKQDMTQLDKLDCGQFDIVVSNPPYLSAEEVQKKDSHHAMLAHEPAEALFANEGGFQWYAVLDKVAPSVLRAGGHLVLECGKGMMDRVKSILCQWKFVSVRNDRQGWQRCLVVEKS